MNRFRIANRPSELIAAVFIVSALLSTVASTVQIFTLVQSPFDSGFFRLAFSVGQIDLAPGLLLVLGLWILINSSSSPASLSRPLQVTSAVVSAILIFGSVCGIGYLLVATPLGDAYGGGFAGPVTAILARIPGLLLGATALWLVWPFLGKDSVTDVGGEADEIAPQMSN